MIGKECEVAPSCEISESADITESVLREEVVVRDYTQIKASMLGQKVQLDRFNSILYSDIGKYCYTGHNTTIRLAKLGNFNSISWNVSIGGNNHDMDKVTTHSFLVYPKWEMGGHSNWESASKDCNLGNDIWIGAGASILRGVHIGDGAVIGAGTIVTKDVPPYAVVAGNPGKVIRMRCANDIIEKMLILKWWDFPVDVIRKHYDVFHSELTTETVEKLFAIKENIK